MANIKGILASILLAGALSSAVHAETISYADAVTKLSQDCGADIKKLCRGLNLGNGRIADCIRKNSASVSPTCTASLSAVGTSISRRQEAQDGYRKECAHDMAQHCRGVKGDGNVLACLIKAERIVGDKCNQTITDTGWR